MPLGQGSAFSRQHSAVSICATRTLLEVPSAFGSRCANSTVAQALAFGHAVRTTL
ncbi:MAG: hypothetical protein F6K50_43855 [Moorea sp. SIO3I7]|uniref:hypothetical protein n=1 Tax=Moorena sp. SIO3I8 TaxID=2607833 RepID=UPI0013C1A73B|nr:hypothetical protein [Moorena sp. SIO3I8]NEO02067.1 hypothetical protein [Moorena sp. SIO3I7]NEO04598.1 hypothetical protein [Moorena sp. SIO3I8]